MTEQGKRQMSRREFLNLTGVFSVAAGGQALDWRRSLEGRIKSLWESFLNPKKTKPEYILVQGDNIWESEIDPEGGIIGAITDATETSWHNWSGLAASLILPDGSGLFHLHGEEGLGKLAIEVTAELFDRGELDNIPEMDKYNFRGLPDGAKIVFGQTTQVDDNLGEILAFGSKLGKLEKYVSARVEKGSEGWTLTYAVHNRHIEGGFKSSPLASFKSGFEDRNWARVDQ